jgi:hypothetical protein
MDHKVENNFILGSEFRYLIILEFCVDQMGREGEEVGVDVVDHAK